MESWDDTFEGSLLTIKGPRRVTDMELQEQTLRPPPKKADATTTEPKAQQNHRRQRSKASAVPGPSQGKAHIKPHLGAKFELPPRPDLIYREQSVEDYSDLVADNDSVFSNGLNPVKKV